MNLRLSLLVCNPGVCNPGICRSVLFVGEEVEAEFDAGGGVEEVREGGY